MNAESAGHIGHPRGRHNWPLADGGFGNPERASNRSDGSAALKQGIKIRMAHSAV